MIGAVAFIIGFAIVFVSIGALFGGFGALLKDHERVLVDRVRIGDRSCWGCSSRVGGPRSCSTANDGSITCRGSRSSARARSGFFFALGWTPCLGPTLAAISGLAAAKPGATALRGSILAFFYCLGLGIPFIVAALATEWVTTASSWLRRHQRAIGRIGGLLLDRHRRARGDGRVAHLRDLVAGALPVVAGIF